MLLTYIHKLNRKEWRNNFRLRTLCSQQLAYCRGQLIFSANSINCTQQSWIGKSCVFFQCLGNKQKKQTRENSRAYLLFPRHWIKFHDLLDVFIKYMTKTIISRKTLNYRRNKFWTVSCKSLLNSILYNKGKLMDCQTVGFNDKIVPALP